MAIYVNQTNIKLRVTTGTDLTLAASSLIHYRKPNKLTSGTFTGTIIGGTDGIIEYNVSSPSDLDMVGTWQVAVEITFNDGRVSYGNYDSFDVLPMWGEVEDWAGFEDDEFTEKE